MGEHRYGSNSKMFNLRSKRRWPAPLQHLYTAPRKLFSTQTSLQKAFCVHKYTKQTKTDGSRERKLAAFARFFVNKPGQTRSKLTLCTACKRCKTQPFQGQTPPCTASSSVQTEASPKTGEQSGDNWLLCMMLLLETTHCR